MSLAANLNRELEALIQEWEKFFAGQRKLPPVKEKTLLGRRIRQAVEHGEGHSFAERFRLEQLQHRFSSYAAMWEKRLRKLESGMEPGFVPRQVQRPSLPERDWVDKLYKEWSEAWERLGKRPPMDAPTFRKKLEAQAKQIEERLGNAVSFAVSTSGGKVKLVARKKKGEQR